MTLLLKRTLKATLLPCASHASTATRRARDTALMRRGCVTAMRRQPAAARNCGICVLLPQPAGGGSGT